MFELVNVWAVFVATVAYFIIGGAWYTVLFAKPWMELSGINPDEKKDSSTAMPYVGTFILLLLLSYVLAQIIALVDVISVTEAITVGAWLWLGFVATTMAINGFYSERPYKLVAIDAGYHLVGIITAATIIALM